jgi:hypothetical protein
VISHAACDNIIKLANQSKAEIMVLAGEAQCSAINPLYQQMVTALCTQGMDGLFKLWTIHIASAFFLMLALSVSPYVRTYYDEQKRADQLLRGEFETPAAGSFRYTDGGSAWGGSALDGSALGGGSDMGSGIYGDGLLLYDDENV